MLVRARSVFPSLGKGVNPDLPDPYAPGSRALRIPGAPFSMCHSAGQPMTRFSEQRGQKFAASRDGFPEMLRSNDRGEEMEVEMKMLKFAAAVALAGAAIAPTAASARWGGGWHGGPRYGGWHSGWYGRGWHGGRWYGGRWYGGYGYPWRYGWYGNCGYVIGWHGARVWRCY